MVRWHTFCRIRLLANESDTPKVNGSVLKYGLLGRLEVAVAAEIWVRADLNR
jgi:hypothetical protein